MTVCYTAFVLDTETRLIQLWNVPGSTREWITPFRELKDPVPDDKEADLFYDIAQSMFSFEEEGLRFIRVDNVAVFMLDMDEACRANVDFVRLHGGPECATVSGWDSMELRRINLHPVVREAVFKNQELFEHVCNTEIELHESFTVPCHATS